MATQCVDNVFSLSGGGLLQVKDCNDNANWAYSCAVGTTNGLYVSEDGCLWTPPRPKTPIGFAAASVALGSATEYSSGSMVADSTVLTFKIINTNTCYTLNYEVDLISYYQFAVTQANCHWYLLQQVTWDGEDDDTGDTIFYKVWEEESVSTPRGRVTTVPRLLYFNLQPGVERTVTVKQAVQLLSGQITGAEYQSRAAWIGMA